jgi:LacI family transcriptional regulator
VLASNDLTAIGALGAIADAGLRVPEDISVIGFDDIQLSAYTQPTLTTVRLPHAEIAKAAVHALLSSKQVNPKDASQGEQHTIQPIFVERKSAGPAPRNHRLQ